ncbi:hypothetical protein ACN26Z_01545 [Verrucosispora sp. WMMD703]|uniref:hypothetical protein n=1 Tax=Verrucosispora sp. WMMD703 TaxID=3403463 RepID=UPI003B95A808
MGISKQAFSFVTVVSALVLGSSSRAAGGATFKVFYGRAATNEVVGEFEGSITCLTAAGEVATATGVITEGCVNVPGVDKDVTGQKVSFRVHDDGRNDRMFWMWCADQ